ncbi:MAG: PIG-L family deacetylase [Acidobacteriota bacterium]|nr:PIG-L family deacetylase [Acidobacteriota bacterium]MDE3107670.1 PIG-L family deacetylase [Acidobacteriota bacterium]
MPVYEIDESITRALVVVAHPDDVDFGSAGTIATLTASGVEVSYCLVTSGDAGGDGSTSTNEERAAEREREQTLAAKEVGVTDLTFLRWPDGRVEVTLELRRAIAGVIRRVKPDLVITQSPERNYERIFASHPDHLAAGEATLRAVYPDARNPHAFPELLREGLEPHTVGLVWLAGTAPTMVVDITDHFERKVAALRQHVSQVGEREGLEEMIRTWTRTTAKMAGLKKGRLAEGFRVVITK